ncbi:MAG: hypothetical protein K2W95_02995 [Candidatus Obscuribacterales bacterium]|nr:hypothetical protein [Candidatus Obscuribacterales bacterium]
MQQSGRGGDGDSKSVAPSQGQADGVHRFGAAKSPVGNGEGGSNALESSHNRITLLPARLDFKSAKVQMMAGWLFALILCLLIYAPTLHVGFLLDDFLHIDYVAAALRGDWTSFLANFTGNWAGSDLMKSYRPIVSLSIFIDALLGGVTGKLYHATNIFLVFLCACFTGMITLEISGLRGNRLGAAAAIWAACLFAVYPLHSESVAWIIGRVDLLCTFFYLVSVWSYFRFRLLRERAYFRVSLVSFVLALLSKEMAVTLPVVILLVEFVLPQQVEKDVPESVRANRLVQRVSYVMSYFFVLGFFSGIRLLLLGTLVGGYGEGGGISLSNLRDRDTLLKILLPFHEEMAAGAWIKPLLIAGYVASVLVLVVRGFFRSVKPGILLFLAGWIVVAILPAFQIWHIWPNLVGSRLFFNSSAPFCILLSLVALPAVDTLPRRIVMPLCALGVLALSAILLSWTALSQISVKPWLVAGDRMARLRDFVVAELKPLQSGQTALFLNLPTDYAGAGMVTRESYLKMLSRPPFATADFSDRIKTIEPPISGSHEFLWPQKARATVASPELRKTFIWDSQSGDFVPMVLSAEKSSVPAEFNGPSGFAVTTAHLPTTGADAWKKVDEKYSAVEKGVDFLRVRPGKQSVLLSVPGATGLRPLWTDLWRLEMKTSATDSIKDKIWLVWNLNSQGGKGPAIEGKAPFFRTAGNEWISWSGRHRDWTFGGPVTSLMLLFEPGDYEVDVLKLVPVLSDDDSPSLRCDTGSSATKVPATKAFFTYGGARNSKLIFTRPFKTFDAAFAGEVEQNTTVISGKPLLEVALNDGNGKIALPPVVAESAGVYQARIVAASDGVFRLPGEPVTFEVVKPEGGQADIRIVP